MVIGARFPVRIVQLLVPLFLLTGCGIEADHRNEGQVIVTEPEKVTSAAPASIVQEAPATASEPAQAEPKP